jgi:predicted RNA-binding Zn ribbon-like protein
MAYELETKMVFSFLGGALPLDFCNTVDWHSSDTPGERLFLYDDWLEWAKQAALITEEEFHTLKKVGVEQPEKAAMLYRRLLLRREQLFRLFSAAANGHRPAEEDVRGLQGAWAEASAFLQISYEDSRYIWKWTDEGRGVKSDLPLHKLTQAAAELLTSPRLLDVRRCEGPPGCGWLFLDTTKNHSRRWCSMQDCGNRAKMRRYQERKTGKRPPEE